MNFQISLSIFYIISFFLMLILVGVLLLVILYFANIVLCIIATVKANDNILYKYPFSIRLVK
ncbi:MAG: DUF4870 domain-containing protein [Chitinophagaceae bacterium]|nr:DUF4870 domain-containing protein [Chitinophagaceae bacterium]